MYSGSGFSAGELGDVEVVRWGGLYHLFHLVLPNHDYIAHAVSKDGLLWRRVKNALFIGDPGAWDDDMLWTMHVSPDPHQEAQWRMFYTGITRREMGRVQRVGVARSDDLFHWTKDDTGHYPLSVDGPNYEKTLDEGRHWVSFRDPFFYKEGDERLLLTNARVSEGPVARRGCVAVCRETEPNRFEWLPPLFYPRMYDDLEVPGLFKIGDNYYLVAGCREDIKVHYWHSTEMLGEYSAFYDNLLLPQGNYAARVLQDEDRLLVWNFFVDQIQGEGKRLFPPPKELEADANGRLVIKSFRGFDDKIKRRLRFKELTPFARILKNPSSRLSVQGKSLLIESRSGYEIVYSAWRCMNFRLRYRIQMEGLGKTGIVVRADEDANGYHISLDMVSGLAQIRAWGVNEGASFDKAFRYLVLQDNHFKPNRQLAYDIQVLCFGGYIELTINERVILSLIDTTYMNVDGLGFYVESACVRLSRLSLEELDGPQDEEYGPI